MKTLNLRWPIAALLIALSGGCAVSDGGYGYNGGYDSGYGNNVGIGVGYYAPFGGDYGGWGPGYNVAPFRGGDHRGGGFDRRGGQSPQHAFRSAPASHSMPSIPSRGGGGGRGGGHSR